MNTLTKPKKLNRFLHIGVCLIPIIGCLWMAISAGLEQWRAFSAHMSLLATSKQGDIIFQYASSGFCALFFLLMAIFGIGALVLAALFERVKGCEARLAQLEKA